MDQADDRIRVLYLAASPSGGTPEQDHDVDADFDTLQEAVAAAGARARFRCLRVNGVRPQDLAQRLNVWKPHIVHFSGHGLRGQGLIFTDDLGAPVIAHADGLRDLFRASPSEHLSLVVLMTCYSRTLARAVAPYVKIAALGVEDRLEDADATAFNHAFYGALAAGRSVQQAYDQAVGLVRFAVVSARNRPDLELAPQADEDTVLVGRESGPPVRTNAQLAQGVQLLDLRLYAEAAACFRDAIRSQPTPEAHYCLALAMLRGRRPAQLVSLDEARALETHIAAAVQLAAASQPGSRFAHYYYLWAWLKADYYERHGILTGAEPRVSELLAQARVAPLDAAQVERILRFVPLNASDDAVIRDLRNAQG